MGRITEVVKNLLIINVLMFVGTQMLMQGGLILAMYYPTSPNFEPYQIVTHMFMHGDFMHIFFNMFVLYMFGPPLEINFGPKRFLFFYLFAGFGSLALYILMLYIDIQSGGANMLQINNTPMLGASGAIMGVLAGFAYLYPNTELMLIFPPIPVKAKILIPILIGLDVVLGIGSFDTGVAHFAHVGGALAGFGLLMYWRKFG